MYTIAGFSMSLPPHNTFPIISIIISHIFHTFSFFDISNFVYKYFLSHPLITFLLSLHTFLVSPPPLPSLYITVQLSSHWLLSSSCSTDYLCNVPFVVFCHRSKFFRSTIFNSVSPPQISVIFSHYLSHGSIRHSTLLYNFSTVPFHSKFIPSSSPLNFLSAVSILHSSSRST